jgi:hypothetical protein
MHGGNAMCKQNFICENVKGKHLLEDQGIAGKLILKWILKE